METAVSIPDELVRQVEDLARRLSRPSGELFRDALHEYLYRHDPSFVTHALDALAAELRPAADRWSAEAGRQVLERSQW